MIVIYCTRQSGIYPSIMKYDGKMLVGNILILHVLPEIVSGKP